MQCQAPPLGGPHTPTGDLTSTLSLPLGLLMMAVYLTKNYFKSNPL